MGVIRLPIGEMGIYPRGQVHIPLGAHGFHIRSGDQRHALLRQVDQGHIQAPGRVAHSLGPGLVAVGCVLLGEQPPRHRGNEYRRGPLVARGIHKALQIFHKLAVRVGVAARIRDFLVVVPKLNEQVIPLAHAVVDHGQPPLVQKLLGGSPVLRVVLHVYLVALDIAVEHLPDARLRPGENGILLNGGIPRPKDGRHAARPPLYGFV